MTMNGAFAGHQNRILTDFSQHLLNVEKSVEKRLKPAERKYTDVFVRHLIATGNQQALLHQDRHKIVEDFVRQAKEETAAFLKNYSSFDKTIAVTNIQNKYGMDELQAEEILAALKREGTIRIRSNAIYPRR